MRATVHETEHKLNKLRAGMGLASKKLKEGFSKINAETYQI